MDILQNVPVTRLTGKKKKKKMACSALADSSRGTPSFGGN